MLLFVLDGLPYPSMVLLRRDAAGKQAILAYARRRWPLAALGGSGVDRLLRDRAVGHDAAPVASVAALRETSVLFAALLGTWMLKERFGMQRAAGTLVIVIGVMALRLA